MKKPSLSVFIITLNEERNITRCLKSLAFSKKVFSPVEIIVVDAKSSDRTLKLARSLGAKTYTRPWKGYADQKSWAMDLCKGDWILSLDADEELTPELIAEMERKVPATPSDVDGYLFKRRAFFLGKWIRHGSWWPDCQLRLIRKGKGDYTNEPVHEGLVVKGSTLEFDEPMNHYTYDTIRQYLEKMNRYTNLEVSASSPKKIRYWWYYTTLAPVFTFVRSYFSRKGYRDGWHGLVVCGLSAFQDFVKYTKLWEKEILRRSIT